MCSQPFCLGRSSIFNHRSASVSQLVRWIGAERILACRKIGSVHQFVHAGLVGWEHSRNDSDDLKAVPELVAVSFGNLNCRPIKAAILWPENVVPSDRLGAHIEKIAAGTIDSQTIPTPWGKHAKIEGGPVISERLGRGRAKRQRFDCTLGRLQQLRLADRSTSNERYRNCRRRRPWRTRRLNLCLRAKRKVHGQNPDGTTQAPR